MVRILPLTIHEDSTLGGGVAQNYASLYLQKKGVPCYKGGVWNRDELKREHGTIIYPLFFEPIIIEVITLTNIPNMLLEHVYK